MNVLVPVDTDEVFSSLPITEWIDKIKEQGYIVLDSSYSYMLHSVANMVKEGETEQAATMIKNIVEALLEDYTP